MSLISKWEKQNDTILHLVDELNINLGGSPYTIQPMTINLLTQGDGGLDVIPAAPWHLYHVLAVRDSNQAVKVFASIRGSDYEATGTRVGFFSTNGLSYIDVVGTIRTGNIGELQQTVLAADEFFLQVGPGWVLANGQDVTGSQYARQTGNTNVPNIAPVFSQRTYIKIC
jgi:hypothetical protein